MELRQLRYFVTIAETLNFHRAAEAMHISQPPLSVAMRKLEDELGAQLFVRGSKGVRLTAAGLAALGPARETLAQADRVREEVRLGVAGETGRVSLGFVGSAVSELLPQIIPAFRARHPHVELELEEMTSVDIVAAIHQRRLDVGLVRLPVRPHTDVIVRSIERDHLIAALPQGHRLARTDQIDLAELAEDQFILHSPISVLYSIALLACQKASFSPRIAQKVTQVQAALCLVQSGLGVALVPSRMSRSSPDGVVLRSLIQPVEIEMGVAWRADAAPAVRRLVEVAHEGRDIARLSLARD